jgi:hypothetical protein
MVRGDVGAVKAATDAGAAAATSPTHLMVIKAGATFSLPIILILAAFAIASAASIAPTNPLVSTKPRALDIKIILYV